MDCQECNKRPATLYFTQIVNGKVKEIRTCEQCAHKYYEHSFQEPNVSFHDFLTEFFDVKDKSSFAQSNVRHSNQELTCPSCHLTLSAFRLKGKFGCHQCYTTFHEYLPSLLRRVHNGNINHRGKIPNRKQSSIEQMQFIKQLRVDLDRCIQEENFEEAAIIRDKIRSLEQPVKRKDGE